MWRNLTLACAQNYNERLQTALGSSSSVVRVGYDVERSVDLFEEWLGKHIEVLLETETQKLKMVDASISYFVQKLAAYPLQHRLYSGVALGLIKYICSLLAKRHEYLIQVFYSRELQAKLEAVAKVKCFIMTASGFSKFEGVANILAKYFTEHETFWWLVKDEYTKETLPTTTVSFRLSLDLCLLVGDPWQRPRSVLGQYLSSGMNTCAWVEQEKVVDLYAINKSWRLGRTMCRVISAVLPECKLLESARPENGDTLFLPILFKSLDGWEYGYGADPEVARNRFIFSHVMSVISLEIVLAVTCPPSSASRGIVVVSFLNELLDGLENYLYSQLESACAMLHQFGSLPLPAEGFSMYSYQ